ncbi:uncharacterized protein LOC106475173 [Limulus polyphemus]|uniref:Uncharacterized protein LOC106475173 n=1 Tax=Limulus polyphemus TaxID=6850 RepID=A0ABM1BZ12_LIMPO|nr:uncharacterized protein LOC106475173 [Limulus polyphemus]
MKLHSLQSNEKLGLGVKKISSVKTRLKATKCETDSRKTKSVSTNISEYCVLTDDYENKTHCVKNKEVLLVDSTVQNSCQAHEKESSISKPSSSLTESTTCVEVRGSKIKEDTKLAPIFLKKQDNKIAGNQVHVNQLHHGQIYTASSESSPRTTLYDTKCTKNVPVKLAPIFLKKVVTDRVLDECSVVKPQGETSNASKKGCLSLPTRCKSLENNRVYEQEDEQFVILPTKPKSKLKIATKSSELKNNFSKCSYKRKPTVQEDEITVFNKTLDKNADSEKETKRRKKKQQLVLAEEKELRNIGPSCDDDDGEGEKESDGLACKGSLRSRTKMKGNKLNLHFSINCSELSETPKEIHNTCDVIKMPLKKTSANDNLIQREKKREYQKRKNGGNKLSSGAKEKFGSWNVEDIESQVLEDKPLILLDDDKVTTNDNENNNSINEEIFTEKYKPTSFGTFVGNKNEVEKMKVWLAAWKTKCFNDAKNKSRNSNISSKSDSDEYSDDDDNLPNCTLITGASGIGKTSFVYAVARELGFRVFELNASSRRTGKEIMTQLQEATQSHHIEGSSCKNRKYLNFFEVGKTNSPKFLSKQKNEIVAKESTPALSKKKSIESFFRTGASAAKHPELNSRTTEGCTNNETSGKVLSGKLGSNTTRKINLGSQKKKNTLEGFGFNEKIKYPNSYTCRDSGVKDLLTESILNDAEKGLSISSMSLILFDDVDVVFENDDGFWSAVNAFIATAKKPVILTATRNVESIKTNINHMHEIISLRPPHLYEVTDHLFKVCVQEGMDVKPSYIRALAKYMSRDIRRCLLQLQFLAPNKSEMSNFCKNLLSMNSKVSVKELNSNHNKLSKENTVEMDTIAKCPTNLNHHAELLDPKVNDILECASNRVLVLQSEKEETTVENITEEKWDMCNVCLEKTTGFEEKLVIGNKRSVFMLSAPNNLDFRIYETLISILNQGTLWQAGKLIYENHVSGNRVISDNLYELLSLPKLFQPSLEKVSELQNCVEEKTQNINPFDISWLNEEGLGQEREFFGNDLNSTVDDSKINCDMVVSEDTVVKNSTLLITHKVNEQISNLLKDLSTRDIMLRQGRLRGLECAGPEERLQSWIWGLPLLSDTSYTTCEEINVDIFSSFEVLSFRKTSQRLREILQNASADVDLSYITLHFKKNTQCQTLENHQLYHESKFCFDAIRNALPINQRLNHRAVHLEYLPFLRSISVSETYRQAKCRKRSGRFLHYFDSISLCFDSGIIHKLQQPIYY